MREGNKMDEVKEFVYHRMDERDIYSLYERTACLPLKVDSR